MWLHIIHWFNTEYWSVSWPNVFAPSFWTLLGFLVADIRNGSRTKQVKLHHIDTVEGLAGQIEALSDKLMTLIGSSDDK